tara:strand:+ start:845 stop:2488 length:1644 start_codon:yes stop_codon:yes gene_type:complete
MTNNLIKILIAIIIIVVLFVIYTLMCERSELQREGLENKDIKNTSDTIMKEPLKNLCIFASSDSVSLDDTASTENVDKLIRKGVRWLDFNITDNGGVPFASETIRFDKVLNVCKTSKKLSQNPNMPLFINIRVTSSGSESFYNNIHKFILDTFNEDELYNKPGEVKTLLSDTKKNVMNIINGFKKDTNESVKKLSNESFTNNDAILGTENELYENLTSLELAYQDNNANAREGMEDGDVYDKIEKQQKKIDKMKKKLDDFEKKLGDTKKKILKKKLETVIASGKKKIAKEEEILKKLEDESIEEETSDLNKIDEDAEKENKEIELIKNQETEPVVGALPSIQRKIDILRNSEALLNLQNTTLQNDVSKLKSENSAYSDSISSIEKNISRMSAGVEKGLTKTVQCERCVTGNTLMGELEDKVIFVLTRQQYAKDEYNKSNLSMNGINGCINIEVKNYNTETDEKLYNVLYSTDKNDTILPVSVFKMSVVPNTTRNATNMIINNIKRRNVQVLQVSNLENKPEYTNMFKHFESAFILMTDASTYIQEFL